MKISLRLILLGALAAPCWAHADPNLILNGSFEQFTLSPSYGFDLPNDWTFTAGDPTASLLTVDGPGTTGGSGATAEDGTYFLAFGAPQNALDTISQTLSTVSGGVYNLSFWVNTDFSQGTPLELTASWGSSDLLNLTTPLSSGGWTEYRFALTGSGSADTLSFSGLDNDGYALLDNVQLVAAPDHGPGLLLTAAALLALVAAASAPARRALAFARG
ncbi:MAG: hypothetical protein ACREFX_12700 [Opitutaceae bacterium]